MVKVKGTLVATKALQKIPDKWLLLLCFPADVCLPFPAQLLLISQLDELLISFVVHNSLTNEKNGNLITLLVEGCLPASTAGSLSPVPWLKKRNNLSA